MRITNNMMMSNFLSNLNRIMKDMDKTQQQIASRTTISKPSDNPTGTARSMRLRTNLAENDQYITNTDYAISWADSAESAFANVTDIMQRARELTVQGANTGVYAQDSLDAIADEVEQLRQNMLLELGNASNGGRFIFGGARTTGAPFKDTSPDKLIQLSVPPSDNNTVGKPFIGDETDLAASAGAGTKSFKITVGNYSANVDVPVTGTETNSDLLGKIKDAINGVATLQDTSTPPKTMANPLIGKVNLVNYKDNSSSKNYVGLNINSPVAFEIEDNTGDNLVAQTGIGRKEITDIIGYNGDNTKLYVQVGAGNVNIDINVPGGEPFASNIAALTNLRNALRSGDSSRIQNALTSIDTAQKVTLTARSDLGARSNRLELISNRLDELDLNYNTLLSNNEDTDIAKAITDLNMQQNAQRAALGIGAKIIVPSLIDFLS